MLRIALDHGPRTQDGAFEVGPASHVPTWVPVAAVALLGNWGGTAALNPAGVKTPLRRQARDYPTAFRSRCGTRVCEPRYVPRRGSHPGGRSDRGRSTTSAFAANSSTPRCHRNAPRGLAAPGSATLDGFVLAADESDQGAPATAVPTVMGA